MRILVLSLIWMGWTYAYADPLTDVQAMVMTNDYQNGLEASEKLYRTASDEPTRVQAQYYLGLCELRLGHYAKSRKLFEYVRQNPVTKQELYEKATLGLIEGYYLSGYYTGALKLANSLLAKYPKASSKSLVYLKIARAYLKKMEWEHAREYLRKIIREFPQSLEAPIAKGLLEEKEFFTVQVGSFVDQEKALGLVDDLKLKKHYAYIVETTNGDGKRFYRVRVGQLSSLDHAQQLSTQLSSQGYPSLIYP